MNDKQLSRISLVLLTLQNTSLILVMRFARTRPGAMFLSSTAVVMSETVKLIACLILIGWQEGSLKGLASTLNINILRDPKDCLLIAVPSLLYVFQNNLLFTAVSHLDAATFQVSYQLKLLTTAIFFRIMLKRSLTRLQWFSLLVLFTGVAVVQIQPSHAKPGAGAHILRNISASVTEQRPLVGLLAVLVASMMSGFAGVFFEKLLKGTEKSLMLRNVQLAGLGIVLGLFTAFSNDGSAIANSGFFYGYDSVVWCVIFLQSVGGLLVAAVVKYADNILKGFATSAAIVLSAVISFYAFDFKVSWQFAMGASLVITATYIYAKNAAPKPVISVPEKADMLPA